jgi:hypothetical protein
MSVPAWTPSNDVLDTCSEISDYRRYADLLMKRFKKAKDVDAWQVSDAARRMCGPDNQGYRYWVAPDMTRLCRVAATTLPEALADGEITFHFEDLPCSVGTVVFETPLLSVSDMSFRVESPREYEEGPIDAIQWQTSFDSEGQYGVMVIPWQGRSHDDLANLGGPGNPPQWPRTVFPLPFGEPLNPAIDLCVLYSLWSMLGQHIALTETSKAPRPSVKRWQRKHGHEPEDIVVVTLRRPTGHHGDDAPSGGVDWTHQWIVDGHWRNQPYGAAHSLRRLQWIAPFIKGPEDKPLILPPKIRVVTR